MSEQGSPKRKRTLPVGMILAVLVIAALLTIVALVTQPQPTPPLPTRPPPMALTVPGDTSWDEIVRAGKIRVGVSADYPPFEFYAGDYQLDGFDIALMRALGQKLGVSVEFNDLAFDGLPGALLIRQIDAAISAISVTPERQERYDFSNVYYLGGDGALARSDSAIQINSASDLAPYRVGVQRGSLSELRLRANVIASGQMPEDNLFVYAKAEDAVRDLAEKRLDVVVLDLQPAQTAAEKGNVKLVGRQLNSRRYAIGIRRGATALRAKLNQALSELQNEGRIATLAQQYLGQSTLPPVEPPPAPEPGPSPEPPACIGAMRWVADLSYPDDNMKRPPILQPGQPFTKGWRVQNIGTCTWDASYRLAYVSGNSPYARMGGEPESVTRPIAAGDSFDFQVNLVAPAYPGTYQGFWQMFDGKGAAFGEKIRVGISVPIPPTPTPQPTQTPSLDAQPHVRSENPTSTWEPGLLRMPASR